MKLSQQKDSYLFFAGATVKNCEYKGAIQGRNHFWINERFLSQRAKGAHPFASGKRRQQLKACSIVLTF
jgi:hypothetical protein